MPGKIPVNYTSRADGATIVRLTTRISQVNLNYATNSTLLLRACQSRGEPLRRHSFSRNEPC